MLTIQLRKTLDTKWENCWPVSDLRPFALLDLISYIFFIKKLDDWELIHPKVKSSAFDNFVYTTEVEEFTWSKLQNLDAKEIQVLFNKEHGVIDLMKNYASLNSLYSDYFKAPLLIAPTPKLIFNAIEIVNIIETTDKISQGAMAGYLFNKLKKTDQNRQEFIPEAISKLMVSFARPTDKDTILDPSAENGSLLINAHYYIKKHTTSNASPLSNNQPDTRLKGIESDLVLLRLAAMNMVLHGIKSPNVHIAPPNPEILKNNYSLILSALLHSDNPPLVPGNDNEINRLEKENLLLSGILENLGENGRAVVIVPQDLLKSDNPSIIKNRKNIIEYFNLEAVITLGQQSDSIYSGAGILIFNKPTKATTENVWFCKWNNEKKKTRNSIEGNGEKENEEFNEVTEILNKWKNRKEFKTGPSRNSFYISANYFKTNNYKLSFNDYKVIRQDSETPNQVENNIAPETEKIIAAKNENLVEFFEQSTPLPEIKKKRRIAPIIMALIILLLGAGAFYWFYFNKGKNNFPSQDKISNTASKTTVVSDSKDPKANVTAIKEPSEEKAAATDSAEHVSTKYKIVQKAWFHFEPEADKRKPLFLTPGRDIILTATKEENGFIYVIYTNRRGEETHGWMNKNDLAPVN